MKPLHLSALLALAACEAEVVDDTPSITPVEEVQAAGAYQVGYTQASYTYRPVGSDTDRTIPVEVWYPVDASTQASPATYEVAGVISQEAPTALDAPAPADGPFPITVYSHGSGGNGLLAYPYAEHIVTHGWIVVAPDHVGNTSLDLLGSGASFFQNTLQRPQDISALLDTVSAGITPELQGQADMEHVFLFGHSFGGYTTFASAGGAVDLAAFDAACDGEDEDPDCLTLSNPAVRDALGGGFADDRIDAIAPQAPALASFFDGDSIASLGIPTLLQSAQGDITTPDATQAEVFWADMTGADDVWLRIPDGGHMSFISICDDLGEDLIELFQPTATQDGCGPDFTPIAGLIDTMGVYMLAFARLHVLDEARFADVFTGEPLSADIRVRTAK